MPGVSLLLVATTLLTGPPQKVTTGSDVIRAMHARDQGKWYRTLSFVQRAIYPDGRTIINRGDSNDLVTKGILAQAVARRKAAYVVGAPNHEFEVIFLRNGKEFFRKGPQCQAS